MTDWNARNRVSREAIGAITFHVVDPNSIIGFDDPAYDINLVEVSARILIVDNAGELAEIVEVEDVKQYIPTAIKLKLADVVEWFRTEANDRPSLTPDKA